MTVLLVINCLAGAGAEKQILMISAGLSAAGFDCSLYWLEDRGQHTRIQGLVESARQSGVAFYPPAPGRRLDLTQILRIRDRLRNSPQAILWTWGVRSELAGLLSRTGLTGVRQVGSMRSANPERIRRELPFWRLLRATHSAFISNSLLNRDCVNQVAPGIAERTAVIYNAIEPEYFTHAVSVADKPRQLNVVMLGNQDAHAKGYDVAVELAELIRTEGLNIRISIGGAPLDIEALKESIRSRGLEEVLTLAGRIADPVSFLSSGHIFLMLSRFEGTPNALLEAMALGLPAVCTRVGDVPHFGIDRVHLRLTDLQPQSVLNILQELWHGWAGTLAMGQAGRDLCRQKFTGPAMISATASVLREVSSTGTYRAPSPENQ